MATIIKRLRVSLPIMRSTRVDTDMRRLMMATLMQQSQDEGDAVVLPDNLRVQRVPSANFRKYIEMLSGITNENAEEVRTKMINLGILPGAGQAGPVPMEVDHQKRPHTDMTQGSSQT